MARVENGGFTARMDEPFVAFVIGMWLPHYEGSARTDRRRA